VRYNHTEDLTGEQRYVTKDEDWLKSQFTDATEDSVWCDVADY